jgi:glycosyltransferase involved in cell wall biosynthesis
MRSVTDTPPETDACRLGRVVRFGPEGLLSQRTGGVSRYFCEVARWLANDELLRWRPIVHAAVHGNTHLRDLADDARSGRAGAEVAGRYCPLPGELRRLALVWSSRKFLRAVMAATSVVHDTGYHFASTWSGVSPLVITIHDLINDEDPAYRESRAESLCRKASAIVRATRIVVPSFATRDALVRVHRVDEARIDVIHHGSRMPRPESHDPIGVPYLLHVGSRGRYKDFATLLRAFARIRRGGFEGVLVNVGGGTLRGSERSAIAELELPAGSIRAIDADDRRLATLYAHARALAVPSRIEGFGIPILEAMSLGCPVACMDAPGCSEVAGDAALLAPIGDDEILAANLSRLLEDSPERLSIVSRGRERAARFSWAESARKHAACYEQAIG